MYKTICLFIASLIMVSAIKAQNLKTTIVKNKGNYFSQHQASIKLHSKFMIKPGFTFNAIAIKAQTDDFDGSYFVLNDDTTYLSLNEDFQPSDGLYLSELVFACKEIDHFSIFTGNISGKITIYLINGVPDELTKAKLAQEKNRIKSNKNTLAFCMEPPSIDQSVWRAGLGSPQYDRAFTEVRHCIVHHAAGSNTETDYTSVVRSYYILHTQTNGWSDIGYNYLIAQDGTIYKGRDPGTGEQDNVRGAHFCGRNSNTMGICILGNYMTVQPPQAALNSLINLISWKLNKDGLDPNGTSYHVDRELGTIAGHRFSCATSCPGDFLYSRISQIKQQVTDSLANCVTALPIIGNNSNEIMIYPNPTNRNEINLNTVPAFGLKQIEVFNIHGKLILSKIINDKSRKISIKSLKLKSGVYLIKLVGESYAQTKRLIIN
ncbi:MAG: hypothetical protein B6I20_08825 [Bacteroidetes bacterium 4572_117]|nr:MAG: hypothetical protein B6I20_08825 [Bacteroidetes bacterium 4572_117]